MRNGALAVLALVVLAGVDARAADPKVNTIKKISVKSGTVEIVGTQKPSFTTFPMSDPPRFVIDISEAVFSGVPEDVTVPANGRITAIKTASYGNDASAIARVVIGFDRDVEPDVQASGTTLVVKVGSGTAPAVASKAAPAPAAAAPAATAAASDTGALGQGRALATAATASQAKPDDQAAKDALTRANAKAEEDRKAAAAAALAEQQRQADVAKQREAIAQAEADRKAKAQADKEARARAEQERAVQQKSMAEAQARADADRKAQANAAKLAAASAAAQKKAEDDAARAEAKRKAQAEAAQAEADRKAAKVAAANAAAEKKAQEAAARAEAKRKAQEDAAQAKAQRQASAAVVAQADTKQAVGEASDARPAAVGGGAEVSNRRKTVTLVGFSPDKSRVFVRTTGPVHYTVSQADDRTIVLELENTTIQRSNDRRPLDTRYFGGPVVEITPRPASGKTVRVSVTLRDKVGYQARQDGNEVSLQFAP